MRKVVREARESLASTAPSRIVKRVHGRKTRAVSNGSSQHDGGSAAVRTDLHRILADGHGLGRIIEQAGSSRRHPTPDGLG